MLDFLLVRKLCQVIREQKIDIIHGHNYEGGLAGVAAKFITRRPFVWNAVNLMSDELHTYGFIKPRFLADWLAAALDWFVPLFPRVPPRRDEYRREQCFSTSRLSAARVYDCSRSGTVRDAIDR